MRKVVAYELLSLDGVAERPDEFFTDFDDGMEDNLARVIGDQDAVLLGRRTYDEWAEFWPSSDIEPFATFINGVPKFVVTTSAPEKLWSNSTFLLDNAFETVRELKQQTGGDIGVHGSLELTQGLLANGLIDELRLVIAPVVHGRGRKLFREGWAARLTLSRCVRSPAGYLLLDYHVEN